MAMVRYHDITDNPKDTGVYKVKGDQYNMEMYAVEHFCTQPQCHCDEVMLEFFNVSKDDQPKSPIFSFFLSLSDWGISNLEINFAANLQKTVVNKDAKSFINELSADHKLLMQNHYKKAKGQNTTSVIPTVDSALITIGYNVGHVEAFGDQHKSLDFTYQNTTYLVDDQYCMNPDCDCNNVSFSFVQLPSHNPENTMPTSFAFSYSLKTDRFEMKQGSLSNPKIADVIHSFMENDQQIIRTCKKRYRDMKEEGKRILSQDSKQNAITAVSEKIGRNEPCPCGSGKKYKKCCG
jgi:hypothetical protein